MKLVHRLKKMICLWMSDVDLDALSNKQKVMAQKMLQEERDSFFMEIGKEEGTANKCKSHRFYTSTKELNINSTATIPRSKNTTVLVETLIQPVVCFIVS